MPDERIQLDNGMGSLSDIYHRYAEKIDVTSNLGSHMDAFCRNLSAMQCHDETKPAVLAMICAILNADLLDTGYFHSLDHSGHVDRVYYASQKDREHIKMLYGLD